MTAGNSSLDCLNQHGPFDGSTRRTFCATQSTWTLLQLEHHGLSFTHKDNCSSQPAHVILSSHSVSWSFRCLSRQTLIQCSLARASRIEQGWRDGRSAGTLRRPIGNGSSCTRRTDSRIWKVRFANGPSCHPLSWSWSCLLRSLHGGDLTRQLSNQDSRVLLTQRTYHLHE